ncbi:MAG TPA: hypothetical protein VFC00_39025 [Micromonosporaceae bacterium]|nr:hypothetical protein [Micromonosporaceae bacterium]
MRTLLRYAAALSLVLLATACASGGGTAATPSQTAMSDAEILAIGKEVAQCFRQNGAPQFPDPVVVNGRLELPDGAEEELESQIPQSVQEDLMRACQSIMDRLPQSAIEGGVVDERQVPGPEDVEALRKWAECVRANGIPEWPDPKADGTFPVRGTPLEAEGKSPRMINAGQACQQYWSGGITLS